MALQRQLVTSSSPQSLGALSSTQGRILLDKRPGSVVHCKHEIRRSTTSLQPLILGTQDDTVQQQSSFRALSAAFASTATVAMAGVPRRLRRRRNCRRSVRCSTGSAGLHGVEAALPKASTAENVAKNLGSAAIAIPSDGPRVKQLKERLQLLQKQIADDAAHHSSALGAFQERLSALQTAMTCTGHTFTTHGHDVELLHGYHSDSTLRTDLKLAKKVKKRATASARLKDMVFVKDMSAALTSGEFALRLGGAEQPGLIDYEGLCNRLASFAERLERHPPEESVLSPDEVWKASRELRAVGEKLEERLVQMVAAQGRGRERRAFHKSQPQEEVLTVPETSVAPPMDDSSDAEGQQEDNRILVYLREDNTVDIDSALKESIASQPFSSGLWERLRGKGHEAEEWGSSEEEMPHDDSRVVQKRTVLSERQRELAKAEDERTLMVGKMRAVSDPAAHTTLSHELLQLDRLISERDALVLLANVDLLFEQVAFSLGKELDKATISDWDSCGEQWKSLVAEFSLLDKQVAPYQGLASTSNIGAGLDCCELRVLEANICKLADRLGVRVNSVNQKKGVARVIKHQSLAVRSGFRKVRRGILFYTNGLRLLGQDVQHAVKLVMKAAFLKYTFQPREVKVCYRAVKDVCVLVPFLIILLIPLSPPGHVLVFSLILKVFPDFFPSPFTERRQNVMRVYAEIKPVKGRANLWA